MVNAVFQEIERKLVNGFIKNSLLRFSVQLDILKVLLLKKELKLLFLKTCQYVYLRDEIHVRILQTL